MAIANKVGANFPDGFSRKRLGVARNVVITTAGANIATIPITEGTAYIIRQVTVTNANASVTGASVGVSTSSDTNLANVVAGFTTLANCTTALRLQDLSIAGNCVSTVLTAPALFVRVNTGATGSVDFSVYGDVIQL